MISAQAVEETYNRDVRHNYTARCDDKAPPRDSFLFTSASCRVPSTPVAKHEVCLVFFCCCFTILAHTEKKTKTQNKRKKVAG